MREKRRRSATATAACAAAVAAIPGNTALKLVRLRSGV